MQTLKARWIFPGTSPPIPDGRITIDDGTIVRVGADLPDPVDLDLGAVAIVPGFVNAHTHLELGPIPWDESTGPEDQIEWLKRVIRSRFDRSDEEVEALIQRNIRSAIEAGTTALGDITTAGRSWDAVATAPVWATVFAEVLGLSEARSGQTWAAADQWLNRLPPQDLQSQTRAGLSPHAPYSTAGWLYRAAGERGLPTPRWECGLLPLATHLGEMPAERELLASRTGPLRGFLDDIGAWSEAEWDPCGTSPIDFIDADRELQPVDWLIAHGNIFEPDEFSRLVVPPDVRTPRRVAVAYCPRTHARFGHPPHPFRAMLAAGVVVCLGTDSLASSPTLSILDEVRFLHRHHPDVPGATLLRMATLNGAWALRRDHQTGSLEPGKSADLAVLSIDPTTTPADPHALWLDRDDPPQATLWRGRFVASR